MTVTVPAAVPEALGDTFADTYVPAAAAAAPAQTPAPVTATSKPESIEANQAAAAALLQTQEDTMLDTAPEQDKTEKTEPPVAVVAVAATGQGDGDGHQDGDPVLSDTMLDEDGSTSGGVTTPGPESPPLMLMPQRHGCFQMVGTRTIRLLVLSNVSRHRRICSSTPVGELVNW